VSVANDHIRAYQDALHEFEQCLAEFERLRRDLQRATVALIQGWQYVSITGINAQFPQYVCDSEWHRSIRATEWPSAEDLASVLLSAHDAHRRALKAWESIPSDDRASLPQPPRR